MSWTHGTRRWSRIGLLCQLLREPQGFPAHRLSLHCSRACAAKTRSAHPCSLLQDRRTRSHLLCTVPVLLSHHWLSTCSRVACCLARALACGIEPSRPLAKHFCSHLRTRRFNSAQTSRSCNSVVSLPGSPRHNRPSASARAIVCLHQVTSMFSTSSSQCRLTSSAAFSSTASDVLHARSRHSHADPLAAAAL
jgi:hypothetical protein